MLEKPRSSDHYDKRFGVIAIEKRYIEPDDLIEALTIQVREDIEKKPHRFIGEIFLDQDIMSPDQIEEVVKAVFNQRPQFEEVFACPGNK
jgi:hypothetical protein